MYFANAASLLYKYDQQSIQYIVSRLRSHLRDMFLNRQVALFAHYMSAKLITINKFELKKQTKDITAINDDLKKLGNKIYQSTSKY